MPLHSEARITDPDGFYEELIASQRDLSDADAALMNAMPATLLAHPVENRPISVEEYARVQTFPDDWHFAGTLAQRYRQIGNAVPVLFGRAIGEHLKGYV